MTRPTLARSSLRAAKQLIVRGARVFLKKNLFALRGRRRRAVENDAVRAWFAAIRRCRDPREQAVLLYLSYRRALGDAIERETLLEMARGEAAAQEVADFYNGHFLEPDEPDLSAENVAAFFEGLDGKDGLFKRVRNKYDKAQSRLNERFACSLCIRHHDYADQTCGAVTGEGHPWEAVFEEFQRALLTHERHCGCRCVDSFCQDGIEGRTRS